MSFACFIYIPLPTMKKYLPRLPFFLLMFMIIGWSINYIVSSELVQQEYINLWFPVWTYYFNLTAKIFWVLALLIPQIPTKVKDYARAWILYILLLALFAHIGIQDGHYGWALAWIVLRALATYFGYGISKK